ncbi:MAG: calcium-binding protein [Shimia sp.]|uniref:calcium-binding protein n=1 Tax=Shimia sp. TaxID=1954381 RepID=UPI004057F477
MRVFAAMALCLFTGFGLSASAQERDGLNLYVFGNSLVHHLSDTDETAVPHWLARLAEADDKTIGVDGQWGFLRDFAKDETPLANWRFDKVNRAWTRQYRNFTDVDWDVVMINPANFIQYQGANEAFDGDNPDKASPVSATLAVIDQRADIAPDRFVIYQGWADMSGYGSFPPSARKFRRYLRFNAADYDSWYQDYVAQLRDARPDLRIDMIPVARVISELVDGGVLFDMTPEDLYTDDAPHGTPTLYLLAGAITYVGLFEAELPLAVDFPETIHVDVRTYWEAVREEIHRLVLEPIRMAAVETPPQTAETTSGKAFKTPAALPADGGAPGMGLADPALAMGLAAISDWGTQLPFIDLMKTARPWVGHLPGQWGGVSTEDMEDFGLMDEAGWVWGIPENIASVEALMLTDQPPEATALAGRYRVTWQGAGTVEMTGRARVTSREDHEIWFEYTPGEGHVGVRIRDTDPTRTGDYVHSVSVVAETQIALFEAGAVFNPEWLRIVRDLRLVRFMDWMQTNASTQAAWDGRPLTGDFTYGWRGVPAEVMVQLANEIGADAWFNMPHRADDAYMRSFAELVRDQLNPDLVAYVEYSNELWNWGFQQAQWALKESEARWGQVENGHMQIAGARAGAMGRIWGDVFGDTAETRLMRVAATHTDWPGLEAGLLEAPLAQKDGAPPPVASFDAYAVTGYFGVGLGLDGGADAVLGWLEEARATAERIGSEEGLQRAALAAFVDTHQYRGMHAKTAEALRKGSLKELLNEMLPYQAGVARDNGLALVMYEGGSHVAGVGNWANNDALTRYFAAFSTSDVLGEIYGELLAGWRGLGGRSFNAFNDVGKSSKWGSWGHLRHLWDETPRHTALTAYNEMGPHWSEVRAEGAFLHGGVFEGGDGPDRIAGTVEIDSLLGGGGDDVLIADGPADRLHGGAGTDRAILPGARAEYAFEQDGAQVRATADGRNYLLTSIEAVAFAASPALVIPMSGLL